MSLLLHNVLFKYNGVCGLENGHTACVSLLTGKKLQKPVFQIYRPGLWTAAYQRIVLLCTELFLRQRLNKKKSEPLSR